MPIRMCMVCRNKSEKSELIRIVSEDNEIFIDKKQKAQCRGMYVCKDCIGEAKKKRVLERSFKRNVEPEVYEMLVSEANSE